LIECALAFITFAATLDATKMINVINLFMISFKGLLVQLNDYYGWYRRTCVLYFVIIGSVVARNVHFADRKRDRPCQVSVDDQEITVPRAPVSRFFDGALSRVQNPITIDPYERFRRTTAIPSNGQPVLRLLGPRDT